MLICRMDKGDADISSAGAVCLDDIENDPESLEPEVRVGSWELETLEA